MFWGRASKKRPSARPSGRLRTPAKSLPACTIGPGGIRHDGWTFATSYPGKGYSTRAYFFADRAAGQECVMKLPRRPTAPSPRLLRTAKSLLSMVLSFACVSTGGIDLPLPAATGAKDKKHKQDPALKGLPITDLSADEAILHALNRLAYGPRPGDIEHVRQMGLAKWIDQPLRPRSIDDPALEARLENYPTLRMSSAKLLAEYPQPKQAEKQVGKQAQGEQRRSDAAAATIARDMQPSPGQAGREESSASAKSGP